MFVCQLFNYGVSSTKLVFRAWCNTNWTLQCPVCLYGIWDRYSTILYSHPLQVIALASLASISWWYNGVYACDPRWTLRLPCESHCYSWHMHVSCTLSHKCKCRITLNLRKFITQRTMEHKQYVYIISVLNYFAICISNLTMQLQYLNQDKIYMSRD